MFTFYFRRKQVGVLACQHWNNKYPKFNTPQQKAELAKFSEQIFKECALPEVGFNREGIAKHIQDFFNEQRRYKKRQVCFLHLLICLPHLKDTALFDNYYKENGVFAFSKEMYFNFLKLSSNSITPGVKTWVLKHTEIQSFPPYLSRPICQLLGKVMFYCLCHYRMDIPQLHLRNMTFQNV